MDDTSTDNDERPNDADEGVIGEIVPAAEDVKPEAPAEERGPRGRRRRSVAIGCLLALLGVLAGGGVALWLSRRGGERAAPDAAEVGPVPEQLVSRVVFSPTPQKPATTPEIIPAETDVVYCFYELSRVPAHAPLEARWWHRDRSLGDLALRDHRREPDATHAAGRFAIYAPDGGPERNGFAAGVYVVELSSPARPDLSVRATFMALPRAAKILQGGGEPEGPPAIRSLQTAAGVADDGRAVEPRSSFASDAERICAVFEYDGVPPGAVLTVRWYAGASEIERARAELPVSEAKGFGQAWLEVGEGGPLPPMQYRVSVHLGDEPEPLASTGFRIEESAEPPEPAAAERSTQEAAP